MCWHFALSWSQCAEDRITGQDSLYECVMEMGWLAVPLVRQLTFTIASSGCGSQSLRVRQVLRIAVQLGRGGGLGV